MVRQATQQNPIAGARAASAALQVQLRGAHHALLGAMDNMQQVTLGQLPERSRFAAARWRLSQASLMRRSLSARIIAYISDRIDADDHERLGGFQAADRRMMQRSAQHVGAWTIDTITNDWPGYCEASREIRSHMKAHVELECRMIMPMLERLATRGL